MAFVANMEYNLMFLFVLIYTVDVKTIPVQLQEFNTSSVPSGESITDLYSLTTKNSTVVGKKSHLNMSNYEEVTYNLPDVDRLTLTPSLITLSVETPVSNSTVTPTNEKSTFVNLSTMMMSTTDSIDIKNGPGNISNNEEVTQNPPAVDGSTLTPLATTDSIDIKNNPCDMYYNKEVTQNPTDASTTISSRLVLPAEEHVSNNTSGPQSKENSTDINSSSMAILTLDSVEANKNVLFVAPKNVQVTHHSSAIGGSNISRLFSLPIKTHVYRTSGGPLTENSTNIYPSEIILTTTTNSADSEYVPFNMSNYKEVCGRQLIPIPKIVEGDKVSFGECPWQISLRHENKHRHVCGAVLLNQNWAITAAHCVINVEMNDVRLILGKYDFSVKHEPNGFLYRKLQTIITHPEFNSIDMHHDLALLRFDKPVKFQPNILPVCIPEDDSNFEGLSAHITGWGAKYYGDSSNVALQGATVPVLNNVACEKMFRQAGYVKKIPDSSICAGSKSGRFDACTGDSGGPMVVKRSDRRWVMAGIIAWGMRCGEPNTPGVYMRVSKFKDWINNIIS